MAKPCGNEIFSIIVNAVLEAGGNDEDLRRILKEPELAKKIAELIVQKRNPTTEVFRVAVDYSMSLDEMIAAGHYDWMNSDITAKHFPVSGGGQREVELELVHLNREASTAYVLEELERRGLRPAKIAELLALGANHPELQKQFPIIAFGSVWRDPSGLHYLPFLRGRSDERDLDLYDYDFHWPFKCRFLAVREEADSQ